VFIPVRANGAQSIFHDLLAFFAVFWRVKAIVVLGVSGGIFFPLFRLLCALTGRKLIVNVDGIESRRKKFSVPKQCFLYWSDRLAQRFAHRVVIDNEALRAFLDPTVQACAVLIAYPGDQVMRGARIPNVLRSGNQCLTICRIEPENQCHVLLEAFAQIGHGRYIFIGNWDMSEYGRQLRQQFGGVPGLEMRDPLYDKTALSDLRENCDYYLHGHSVGGTNPSLVEMLFYDCVILAFDCAFNRCTAGDAINYFTDTDTLAAHLRCPAHDVERADRGVVRQQYTQTKICENYTSLVEELTGTEDPKS
jgi:glycosyltransferase involved in cell wall biosynthesis